SAVSTLGLGALSKCQNQFGYAGYQIDGTLSSTVYRLRSRIYTASLGRFLQRDPLNYVDGMSLYQYVQGRLLALVDPFGLYGDGARAHYKDPALRITVHVDSSGAVTITVTTTDGSQTMAHVSVVQGEGNPVVDETGGPIKEGKAEFETDPLPDGTYTAKGRT